MNLSSRMSRIAPSATLRVTAEADRLRRAGVDVVDLGAGEPDFPTPDHIKTAARDAIDANFTKYTPSAGIMELRQAISDRYRADYGIDCQPEETMVTAGGKQSLYNVAMALFDEGDEVITHGPFWPSIPEQIKLAGATPVIVHAHAEDGFSIHAASIIQAMTARTKAIIINSPCNPTGALIAEDQLAAIADAAAERGLWVIADLTYEKLVYEDVPHNLPAVLYARMKDRTVLCSAASKAYAMTGWRAGWTIAPTKLISACNAIQGHSTSNVTSITQKAAVAALTGPQDGVTTMLDEYRERRNKVWEWLTADPRFSCVKPRGAFYLFPYAAEALEATGLKTTSEFAELLLQESHVALTAGEGFDAPGYFRISYATSLDRLREGVTRIQEFVRRRAKSPLASTAR